MGRTILTQISLKNGVWGTLDTLTRFRSAADEIKVVVFLNLHFVVCTVRLLFPNEKKRRRFWHAEG
jgi:hypothetical protein